MPVTSRGVYHNLKESKYATSNGDVAFFFSSVVYRDKFLNGYKEHRERFKKKFDTLVTSNVLNTSFLADIDYYKRIEKRGFRAWVKGVEISWLELNQYALGRMTKVSLKDWHEMQKPSLQERRKIMA